MTQLISGTSPALGLMAFWARIDDDYLLKFQQWHNCEHVPERVSIPGFLRGRRYRDMNCSPFFLMFYETINTECLGAAPYLAALNTPTPWTKEALTHFREPARNIYTLRTQAGDGAINPAPYLASMRFNLADSGSVDAIEKLGSRWLDSIAKIGGVRRARLYEVDETITGIVTSERKIYGNGPGAQQYLTLIEADLPHETWSKQVVDALFQIFPANDPRIDLTSDYFWLEFGYTDPSWAAIS